MDGIGPQQSHNMVGEAEQAGADLRSGDSAGAAGNLTAYALDAARNCTSPAELAQVLSRGDQLAGVPQGTLENIFKSMTGPGSQGGACGQMGMEGQQQNQLGGELQAALEQALKEVESLMDSDPNAGIQQPEIQR